MRDPTRWLAPLALALVLATAGCQARAQTEFERVRGLVIAVEAQSIARAEVITVRADDGRELRFRLDAAVDVTPGHLREHMTLAEPVVVTYRPDGDGLLALRVDDG
jgi:hypothetical protein